ncbi:MAG: P-II family nitrogen regulator [Betaproteobacteria bacterium]
MKEIKAIIRPNKLPALREALREFPGFPGMTVSKVEGLSALSRLAAVKSSIKNELTDYTPKIRIEIVASDEFAETIVDIIVTSVNTGQVGDGLVWVTPIERAVFVHKTMAGAEGVKDYPK